MSALPKFDSNEDTLVAYGSSLPTTTTVVTSSWDFSVSNWQTYSGTDWSATVFHGQYDHGDYYASVGESMSSRWYTESHDVIDALSYQFGEYYWYQEHGEHSETSSFAHWTPDSLSYGSSWLTSTTDLVSFQGPELQFNSSHAVSSGVSDSWFTNPWGSMQSHTENTNDTWMTRTASPGFDTVEVQVVGTHYEHTESSGFLDWGGRG